MRTVLVSRHHIYIARRGLMGLHVREKILHSIPLIYVSSIAVDAHGILSLEYRHVEETPRKVLLQTPLLAHLIRV